MTTKTQCRAENPESCRYHGSYELHRLPSDPETHRSQSEKLMFFLDQDEKEAISAYVDQDYMKINACLYGSLDADPYLLKQIEAIDSALAKYKQFSEGKEVVTYRATKSYLDFTDKNEAKKWVKENFPVGQEVTLPGFTSTTPNPEALFDFLPESLEERKPVIGKMPWHAASMEEWEEKLKKEKNHGLGNLIFVVKSKSGVPVSSYGQTYALKEQEYLHARDSRFVVEKVEPYRKVKNPSEFHRREAAYASIVTLVEK